MKMESSFFAGDSAINKDMRKMLSELVKVFADVLICSRCSTGR